VQAVAAKLNRELEGLVRFETVLWEETLLHTAERSFQPQIPEAVACDVVVSIFWTRLGRRAAGRLFPACRAASRIRPARPMS